MSAGSGFSPPLSYPSKYRAEATLGTPGATSAIACFSASLQRLLAATLPGLHPARSWSRIAIRSV